MVASARRSPPRSATRSEPGSSRSTLGRPCHGSIAWARRGRRPGPPPHHLLLIGAQPAHHGGACVGHRHCGDRHPGPRCGAAFAAAVSHRASARAVRHLPAGDYDGSDHTDAVCDDPGMEMFDYGVLVVGPGFGGSATALRPPEKGYRAGLLGAGRPPMRARPRRPSRGGRQLTGGTGPTRDAVGCARRPAHRLCCCLLRSADGRLVIVT